MREETLLSSRTLFCLSINFSVACPGCDRLRTSSDWWEIKWRQYWTKTLDTGKSAKVQRIYTWSQAYQPKWGKSCCTYQGLIYSLLNYKMWEYYCKKPNNRMRMPTTRLGNIDWLCTGLKFWSEEKEKPKYVATFCALHNSIPFFIYVMQSTLEKYHASSSWNEWKHSDMYVMLGAITLHWRRSALNTRSKPVLEL